MQYYYYMHYYYMQQTKYTLQMLNACFHIFFFVRKELSNKSIIAILKQRGK